MFFTKEGRDEAFAGLAWKTSSAYDDNCQPVNGSVNLDCWQKQHDHQLWVIEVNDYALAVGKIAIPAIVVCVVGWALLRNRTALEASFVSGVASLIKGKREASGYARGLKSRIDEKTDDRD